MNQLHDDVIREKKLPKLG